MQLSQALSCLPVFVLALASLGMILAASDGTGPAAVTAEEPASYIMSYEQMMHWISTTDSELKFVGKPPNRLAPRSAQDTTVTYCSNRTTENTCGGPCTVYTGQPICIFAPDTNCLSATNNVKFCSSCGCSGACTQLTTQCELRLDDGFCFTPDTVSIEIFT